MAPKSFPLWLACLLAGTGLPSGAAEFAPPAEGPVAFRRDKIPLDVDAMSGLSRNLIILADALDGDTPVRRRSAAQMMALALALDPANGRARELMLAYQEDTHKPSAQPELLEKSRARVWQYISWLETPEAGSQGQALAACLKDVIVVSDPENPKAASLRDAAQKGAWAGWVPPVSAYETKAAVAEVDPVKPAPEVFPETKNDILLEKARVQTVLWQKVGKTDEDKWVLAQAPLEMTATNVPPGGEGDNHQGTRPFSIVIGTNHDNGSLGQMGMAIRSLLAKQKPNLPAGVQIAITSKELESALGSKKRQSISAAAAVLASSALSGREPDAVILGTLDESGAFKMPTGFWDQLQALGKGTGQRLVLPAEAAAVLPSILALEKPGFFMEYEVLLATDFKQLVEFAAKTPEGPLANATKEFRLIRERAGNQDVRQYIANTFVKQRLGAVYQEAPAHFSAKMLLIQAAGNRPTLVAKTVLASELRRALEPMVWLVKNQNDGSDIEETSKIGQTYELCRSRVDGLERYAEKNDRSLLDHARELVIAIRNLDRATRTRGENYVVAQAVRTARADLQRMAKEFNDELAGATGELQAPAER